MSLDERKLGNICFSFWPFITSSYTMQNVCLFFTVDTHYDAQVGDASSFEQLFRHFCIHERYTNSCKFEILGYRIPHSSFSHILASFQLVSHLTKKLRTISQNCLNKL